ncbi:MAG: CvpA family protein [Flavobacteriaceae bacterium]
MNLLDIILLIFLLFGFVRGLWSGLFVALASFVSLLAGIFIAIKFSSFTATFLRDNFSTEWQHLEIIAFAITFVIVVITIMLLAKILTKIADFSGLGWLNKVLGGVFGVLKTLLILSIFLHFFQKINQNNLLVSEEKLKESLLYQPVSEVSEMIFPTLSQWFDTVKTQVQEPV